MKSIKFPVAVATCYLILYTILHQIGVNMVILLPMFSFSQFIVIWMVNQVIRKGTPSGKTFDEQFYEDMP